MAGSGTGTAIGSVSGPTEIVNMALCRIGAPTVVNYETDASVPAQKARLFYNADRRALLRRAWWRFAKGRESLAVSATAPDFEYDNAFALPSDFIALRYIYDEAGDEEGTVSPYTASIEGDYILSNEDTMKIVYTANITDTAKFDDLFVQVLVAQLALHLVFPLVKLAAVGAADRLKLELDDLLKEVRMMDLAEQNLVGRNSRRTWLDARRTSGGLDLSRLGS